MTRTKQKTRTKRTETKTTATEMTEQDYRRIANEVMRHRLGLHEMPEDEYQTKKQKMRAYEQAHTE